MFLSGSSDAYNSERFPKFYSESVESTICYLCICANKCLQPLLRNFVARFNLTDLDLGKTEDNGCVTVY